MTLWTSADAQAATGGQSTHDWTATGVSIDTRTLQPGDLFVALKDIRDGHDFVAQALEKGAAAALVSHRPDAVSDDAPLLIVDNVLDGLTALGIAARDRTSAGVVGITGSVGKTSTKEMLRDVLSAQGMTHAAEASYNNHWGVPLTLARMPVDTKYAVIEIGMNHPGEIGPLSRMTRPHVALITTVAAAHLEAFDSIEGISREKAAIIDGLVPGGTAILNADIDTASILQSKAAKREAKQILFGHMGADFRLNTIKMTGDATVIQVEIHGEPLVFKLSSAGRHFAMNAVAVLAAVQALGADIARAALDITTWQPPAGRGRRERLVLDDIDDDAVVDLIDDAYNANPTSITAALEVLAAAIPIDNVGRVAKGRRIAILGDMLELGEDEMKLHRAIADDPSLPAIHRIHCVGPRMQHLWQALPSEKRGNWVETATELAEKAHSLVDPGDVVLVKGSKGSQVSRVVDALRKLGRSKNNKPRGTD
ncbi:UDP-N-acetylmuramoyl-tripeptide--D-alanyl-D-alanine ligase [Parasulfitobacter algicola]|uniref:UDP-N-acetylmuramoyl-tripeptide--D-alanyl-D-alanine ligase n=1 Tax=Parasulfitobacter algicola TaxID=2614809 RepID=A0ABX2IQA2_9RHOB|nr:UDP-N-acetylmuramoyl-tripeptide--D-alanyl-D-alanine ligase [Sulfitobacter algicola]NSX54735.1 UDP-N-acetylmuramoyl-tripeptide--D-alanyl-D-alanine ligase [Sulfitobacter algicola]